MKERTAKEQRSITADGLHWRAQNLRRTAADMLSRARELEKAAAELSAEIPELTMERT